MPHPDEGTIHAWLDGELSLDEGAALEEHLGTCDECVAHVAEARGLIAGSARIMGILDDVPGGVIPATTGRASGMTSLGEMLTAKTGEGPSVELLAPEAVAVKAARRPWWMSNQVRAAAAVLLVVGGVFVSWGRLNKGEVALKDSATSSPEFLAVHADTIALAGKEAAPTVGSDLSATRPTVQTAVGAAASNAASPAAPLPGTPGSRTETKVAANTPPPVVIADSVATKLARAELASAQKSSVAADVVRSGAGAVPPRPDTATPPQVVAQRLAQEREEQRRRSTLASVPVAPPEVKKAVVAERDAARDATTSAAAAPGRIAGGVAAAPSAAPQPTAPSRADVLRHPNAGCYTIQSASWSPALSTAELAAVPTSFELDTLTATGGPSAGRGLVHPRPESVRSQYEAMFWQPDAGGKATVTMRGAQNSLTLALSSGGTQGLAMFSRRGGAMSSTLITLSRAACR